MTGPSDPGRQRVLVMCIAQGSNVLRMIARLAATYRQSHDLVVLAVPRGTGEQVAEEACERHAGQRVEMGRRIGSDVR